MIGLFNGLRQSVVIGRGNRVGFTISIEKHIKIKFALIMNKDFEDQKIAKLKLNTLNLVASSLVLNFLVHI